MKEKLSESHKFKLWKANLEKSGLAIHGVNELYTRFRHNGEALFALVEVDATTPEGDKIPPVCFIKGEVVSVMVVLIDEESGEKYNLLVRQRRICNGDYIYEQVAGMVDLDDDPLEVAVREVEEETGVKVSKEQLIRINEKPYYSTTGTSDEAMYFFYCEIKMSKDQIWSYHEQKTGEQHEHERIITHVATIPEARKLITNAIGLLNIFFYHESLQA